MPLQVGHKWTKRLPWAETGIGQKSFWCGAVLERSSDDRKEIVFGFWKRSFYLITVSGQKNDEYFLFEMYFELLPIISP